MLGVLLASDASRGHVVEGRRLKLGSLPVHVHSLYAQWQDSFSSGVLGAACMQIFRSFNRSEEYADESGAIVHSYSICCACADYFDQTNFRIALGLIAVPMVLFTSPSDIRCALCVLST